jgi:type VI secretion system secreted protein Hcp
MDAIILDMGDGVRGESSLAGYEGKIELLSFSHGVAMQMTGDISNTERTSGRPSHQDFTVTKYLDAASPVLNQACCEGKEFPQAHVIIGRNDGRSLIELMRYTLRGVLISSISIGGGGGDKPVETLTLNYNKIEWNYTAQRPEQGKERSVEGKWDLAQNAAR